MPGACGAFPALWQWGTRGSAGFGDGTEVAHVLGKLDLRDRVQAVVFAYETGLVQPGSAV